ncbi:hypothetical protein ABT214_05945 [Micromonospora purpureochromogenes]|uniref:hypothetical protein n=1 Tax=Micromonospora purpureochromogenes TaxID=47872 RepID=UPI0033296EE3
MGEPEGLGGDLFELGVSHHTCADRAIGLLQAGAVALPDVLPHVFLDDDHLDFRDLDQPPVSGTCPYCGREGQMTDEHVWPRWVSKLLREHFGTFDPRKSKGPVSRETIKLLTRLCESCNGNWLDVLETDVKPILAPMIVPKAAYKDLNPSEQRLLAVWAYKTALMFDLADQHGPRVPAYHHELLRIRREVPNNVRVWIGAYNRDWAVRLHVADLTIGQDSSKPNARVFTFTAFRVLFQVFIAFPWGSLTLASSQHHISDLYAESGLHSLTPSTGRTIRWPLNGVAFNDEAMDVLAGRFDHYETRLLRPGDA